MPGRGASEPLMWPRWPESSPAMSPIFCSGATTSTLTIGSSTIGARLGERVEERLAPGGDERHFLRIHRVVLAVVDVTRRSWIG